MPDIDETFIYLFIFKDVNDSIRHTVSKHCSLKKTTLRLIFLPHFWYKITGTTKTVGASSEFSCKFYGTEEFFAVYMLLNGEKRRRSEQQSCPVANAACWLLVNVTQKVLGNLPYNMSNWYNLGTHNDKNRLLFFKWLILTLYFQYLHSIFNYLKLSANAIIRRKSEVLKSLFLHNFHKRFA